MGSGKDARRSDAAGRAGGVCISAKLARYADTHHRHPHFLDWHLRRIMGAGLFHQYIDAVCNGIDDIPTIDETTRKFIKRRLDEEGLPSLVEELKKMDPEHYDIIDRNNPRRVVHALEICHMTGKTYTSFRKNTIKQRPFNIIKIGLNRPREELYERIDKRVIQMIENGLIDEARKVYQYNGINSLNTVGYKELFEYFNGNITLSEAVLKIQNNSHKYCRKQLTWFKKDDKIQWFNPDNIEEIINYIDRIV